MEPEISEPELLNKCVLCHKSNIELKKHSMVKPIGEKYKAKKFYKINFSLCPSCSHRYDKFRKAEDSQFPSKTKSIIYSIFAIMYLAGLGILFAFNMAIGVIFIMPGLVLSIYLFFKYFFDFDFKYKRKLKNINKNFEVRDDGIVVFRDKQKRQEVNILSKIQTQKVEKQKNIPKFCIYCGSPVISNTGFCSECGKNLLKTK